MSQANERTVRIGGASGFWGDSSLGLPQLLGSGPIDYIVFDYLAEVTMSILSAARLKRPEFGYATDFVSLVAEHAPTIAASGVRLIANAGGVNPRACAAALRQATHGLPLRIAFVEGDDVMPLISKLRLEGIREIQDGRPLPEVVLTANAYLGALPIKAALDSGAHIVVTGRCVDSAVTLGALMHEFNWSATDYDELARASIAGHVIECGCQGSGGLYTDWREVPDWEHMGFPILECTADGGVVVTKPANTGGLVTPEAVGEQILYEVGDPARYLLPDVICDFSQIHLAQEGPDRVRISGIKGHAPTNTYKVSATYLDGYKAAAQLTVIGFEAVPKARRVAEALLARTRAIFQARGLADYAATLIEVLGGESAYGPHSKAGSAREVVLRIAVRHTDKSALEIFAKEIAPAGTAFCPGITGLGGRPQASPAINQFAFLLPKDQIIPHVVLDSLTLPVPIPTLAPVTFKPAVSVPQNDVVPSHEEGEVEVPLIRIARGRSGDKGNVSNIGIIARSDALFAYVSREVSEEGVATYLGHLVHGTVRRYFVPGLNAFNFICENALGGGGMASLRNDPYGKGMAQILLSMPVRVPSRLLGAV